MTAGALVHAQPRGFPAARETWEHAGLRCAIIAAPIGGWNGYVQLPYGHPWRDCADFLEVPISGLSWGRPYDDDWIGFDTGHAGDAWHPDDDSPPYQPSWWPLPDEVIPGALENMQWLRRQLALSLGRELWTMPKLRAAVDNLAEMVDLAELLHVAGEPPP